MPLGSCRGASVLNDLPPAAPTPGEFSQTRVGDATDTSPYVTDKPVTGISTGTYIENMGALIGYLAQAR